MDGRGTRGTLGYAFIRLRNPSAPPARRDARSGSRAHFASDERQTKRTAREMMRMMGRINGELLPAITARGTPPVEVQCITCHRGAPRPLMLEDT